MHNLSENQTGMKDLKLVEMPRLDTRVAQHFLDVIAWNGMAPVSTVFCGPISELPGTSNIARALR